MSIYISGVSLPKMPDYFEQGEEVPYIDIRIFASGDAVISKGERPYFDEFKAIEVPPHGRLGDLDAMMAFVNVGHLRNPLELSWSDADVASMIDSRPTIIPAEGGEKV